MLISKGLRDKAQKTREDGVFTLKMRASHWQCW
jgi:hypothetical protein